MAVPVAVRPPDWSSGSRQHLVAVEQILEVGTTLLETRRVDVRQVVGDHIQLGFHGLHAGGGRIQRLDTHVLPPRSPGLSDPQICD